MQLRYWNYMVQLKAWLFYLDGYSDESYRWQKRVDVFLAITSSSSIAAWVIWNKYSFVWAFLIAVSQVVTAIKPHLPFAKRLELLCKASNQLQVLFNKAEYNWYKVSNGELSEDQINDLLFDFKKQYTDTVDKTLDEASLPDKEHLRTVADTKTEEFFKDAY